MKTSPIFMGLLYFLMGMLFTFLSIESTANNIWSFSTIVLMLVATIDFGVAIKMFLLSNKNEKKR